MACFCRSHPCTGLGVTGTIIIEHLLRNRVGSDQLLRARQPQCGGFGNRRRLINRCQRRAFLRLCLSHQRLCGLDTDLGPGKLRLGLAFLRVQLNDVHLNQNIAGLDQITLSCIDCSDPPAGQCRDIDLRCLDPTIGTGKTCRQTRRLQPVPGQPPKCSYNGEAAQNDGVPARFCHDPPLMMC